MDYDELRHALVSKAKADPDNRNHVFYYVTVEGRERRVTKLSHAASGHVDPDLLSKIARQMWLTNKELRAFVDCELSRDGWLALGRSRGRL